MNKTKHNFDIYAHVNELILSQLGKIKDGDSNYLINGAVGLAYNPISKTLYKGVNMVLLYILSEKAHYTHNAWATFNQITKAGGTLKKGSKAAKVIFYKFIFKIDGKNVSEITAKTFAKKHAKDKKALERLTKKAVLKYYNVFHLSNVEGLDHLVKEYNVKDFLQFQKHDLAQNILDNSGAVIRHKAVNVAFYTPLTDEITLPLTKFFKSNEKYYTTAFHELSHWTGHHSRLDRIQNGDEMDRALEELIAEFSAAYLTAFCEIPGELQNSAAYINHWIEMIEQNKTFAVKAINKAQKSASFILDKADVSLSKAV